MNGRERILAAIRHEETDRIPVDAIAIETLPEVAAYLGIAEAEVEARLGIDTRQVLTWGTYQGPPPPDEHGQPRNEWGAPTEQDYGTAHVYPLAGAETVKDVENYPFWPDPAKFGYDALAAQARALDKDYAVRGPYWMPISNRVFELMGMEPALLKLCLYPEVFDAAMTITTEITLAVCERLIAACGEAMPILSLADDFASQRGLIVSPELWRRHFLPHYRRLFELGKRHGKYIWFHSCGDISAVLPDLIDAGMDVWETVQLHTLPMSAEQLKREYGHHITFSGGINTQRLPFVKPEEVREEVLRAIAVLGEGGGYICGPDHHIKPGVPPENTVALFDTATGYRRD